MECINPDLLEMFGHMCLGVAIYLVSSFAWEVHKDNRKNDHSSAP